MKTIYTNTLILAVFFLFVNCTDTKKTSESTNTTTSSKVQDSIVDKNSLEALHEEINALPHHYICYKNDDNPTLQLTIAFDAGSNALFVKYKGQKDSIPLKNIKEDFTNDGAYPTITQFYDEMYQGKKNGIYELTHAGVWDYAKYTREKDGKVFQFTIDHEMTIVQDNYRTTPCF